MKIVWKIILFVFIIGVNFGKISNGMEGNVIVNLKQELEKLEEKNVQLIDELS